GNRSADSDSSAERRHRREGSAMFVSHGGSTRRNPCSRRSPSESSCRLRTAGPEEKTQLEPARPRAAALTGRREVRPNGADRARETDSRQGRCMRARSENAKRQILDGEFGIRMVGRPNPAAQASVMGFIDFCMNTHPTLYQLSWSMHWASNDILSVVALPGIVGQNVVRCPM